ncbi:Protein PRRC1-A [Bulinus truncatus]|nr:Protein PRRC1-A [Bulinus truncatus]
MMEETIDEQPEMVSLEEAVQAEKEATQTLTSSFSTTPQSQVPKSLAAPAPLPAFLTMGVAILIRQIQLHQLVYHNPLQYLIYPKHQNHLKFPMKKKLKVMIQNNKLQNVISYLPVSGGDITITVASAKDSKVIPVREAFQKVFGRATVTGKAQKELRERIANLIRNGNVPDGQTVIAVEGFIVELLPDRWFELSCLVLKDLSHGIDLQTFSQPTPIPTEYVLTAQDKTSTDYPLRWAGLSVTIGEVIETAQPHIGRADWQMVLSGNNSLDLDYNEILDELCEMWSFLEILQYCNYVG